MIEVRQLLGLALFTVVAALGWLALWPTNSPSYSCDRPPVARMVRPQPERDNAYFFDSGTQCNADARARGRAMLPTGLVGLGLTVALVADGRTRDLERKVESVDERDSSLAADASKTS